MALRSVNIIGEENSMFGHVLVHADIVSFHFNLVPVHKNNTAVSNLVAIKPYRPRRRTTSIGVTVERKNFNETGDICCQLGVLEHVTFQ